MKIIGVAILILIFLGVCYSTGYSKGAKDFALMDHVLMGQLARQTVLRCSEKEDAGACYQWDQESNANHSLIFYTQYSPHLSKLAPFLFEDNFNSYEKAVDYLASELTKNGVWDSCSYLSALGDEAIKQCYNEVNEFIRLTKYSSNK